MKFETCDILSIEGIIPEENEIQYVECIEVLKTEKSFIIEIENVESFYLSPKSKPPLKNINIDNILYPEIQKPENQIQSKEQFFILKSPKNKELNYSIESNNNFLLKPKEKSILPLEVELNDTLIVDGLPLPEAEIQKLETLEILGSKPEIKEKEELKNISTNNKQIPLVYEKVEDININPDIKKKLFEDKSKKDNINIEKMLNLHIPSKEKEILELQIIDRMLMEPLSRPENEIQQTLSFNIARSFKVFDIIQPENDVYLYIEPTEKEPLEKQTIDSLFVDKSKKEDNNKIERKEGFNILKKAKEIKPKEKEKEDKNKIERKEEFNILKKAKEIKPKEIIKEKEDLKINNFSELFIQKLKPSFKGLEISKELQESFNKVKVEIVKIKPPLTINNSEIFIKGSNPPPIKIEENKIEKVENPPSNKLEENKIIEKAEKPPSNKFEEVEIERTGELNIAPIDINEDYILNLINKNNLDKDKFNLRGKNKGKEIEEPKENNKIVFIKEKMDDLYFSEQPRDKEKPFKKLLKKRESEIIINREIKPEIKPQKKIDYIIKNENSFNIQKQELSQDKIYLLFLEKWKKEELKVENAVKFGLEKVQQKEEEKEKGKEKEKDIKINKIVNLSISKSQELNIKGDRTSEYYKKFLESNVKEIGEKQQFEPKSEINIFIQQEKKPSEEKQIISLPNKLINLESSKPESIKLEGNISQKYYEELLLIQKKIFI